MPLYAPNAPLSSGSGQVGMGKGECVMLECRVSVRALAEFGCMAGDLCPAQQLAQRMQEGAAVHRLRQEAYPPAYEREAPLSLTRELEGVRLTLHGRADGLCRGDAPLVEEIKSTRLDLRTLHRDSIPAHWAQALLYARMLQEAEGSGNVLVRLVYVHISGAERVFQERLDGEALEQAYLSYALPYVRWQLRLEAARGKMLPTLSALSFPFDSYRDGQYELAGQSYLALRHHTLLLAQAPTGIGKTAAVLFAALKALGEGHVRRIFYLTARGTARTAAAQALEKMRDRGLWLRSIAITAKEKLCSGLVEGRCDPTVCPLAIGYYDRQKEALKEALDIEDLHPEALMQLAGRHELCPFELQLDISEHCDVVVCDYNYAFDPRVRLKRFFQDRFDGALLIDEAHNLVSRARDMLSASLSMRDYARLYNLLKKSAGPGHPLAQAAKGVWRCLKGLKGEHERPGWEHDPPENLCEALEIYLEAARPYLGEGGELGRRLGDRYFESLHFTRIAQDAKEGYRTLYEPGEKELRVTLRCCNPAPYLSPRLHKTKGAVLFSATLSPMWHYGEMLGLDQDKGDSLLDLPSPFPMENLCVLRHPLVTTYARREESAAQVARAILAMCRARPGNYLAFFPSYAYLKLVGAHVSRAGSGITLKAQLPGMGEAERNAFLDAFRRRRPGTLLGLVVMGGVFAEGIDLPGNMLSGAAIVGVGFPQLSLERAALSAALEEEGEPGDGMMGAYLYPGMERVLQAAGRVIRTETDRGVVLLIDERYRQPVYEELLPPHWRVQDAGDLGQLGNKLEQFWG